MTPQAPTVTTRERSLARVLDALPFMVSFVGTDERHLLVNAAYKKWFARGDAEFVGKTLRDVFGKALYADFEFPFRRALAGESLTIEQVRLLCPLGSEQDLSVSLTPHRGDDGEVVGVVVVLEDITSPSCVFRAREQLGQQRAAALESIADGFFVLDNQWCVLLVNTAFERMCNKPRAEMLGQNFWDLFPQASDPATQYSQNYRRCMAERVEVCFDTRLSWTEGWLEIRAYPISDGGIAVLCRDVSEAKRADEAIACLLRDAQIAEKQAEDANRTKDELLSTASHELRTPLNAILGWVQLLRSGQLDASAAMRAVETIERNAKSQIRLIEDILDGSRIVGGKLQLETHPLDLTAVVRAALDAVRLASQAKQIQLSVAFDSAAAAVIGDPERLQQVVWNLVNNAIKFTPKGGRVDVALKRIGTSVELSVADSGQGIDAAFLPHVFERFRQAEGSLSRRHGGLGLGLALVRHLVEAHGGTVAAESAGQGRGARFIVLLPAQGGSREVADTPPARIEGERGSLSQASLIGVSVLVVDDEDDSRDLIATVLRASGAEVSVATGSRHALELLATWTPTVLVSDVGMPEVDGYEFIRRVRGSSDVESARMPAVALTGYSREQDRREALEAGFQTHVAKPVEPAELVRVVANLAQLIRRRPSAAQRETALERADIFLKFQNILRTRGIHEALRFLNSRTPHRFTGMYRFDMPTLRNLALVDAYSADVVEGNDVPISETYCAIVAESERSFMTEDTRSDERLRLHPARESVLSYSGVLLQDDQGKPFGTLCHFDLVPCEVPLREVTLMEAASPALMRILLHASS